jgi:hypothetical protein
LGRYYLAVSFTDLPEVLYSSAKVMREIFHYQYKNEEDEENLYFKG